MSVSHHLLTPAMPNVCRNYYCGDFSTPQTSAGGVFPSSFEKSPSRLFTSSHHNIAPIGQNFGSESFHLYTVSLLVVNLALIFTLAKVYGILSRVEEPSKALRKTFSGHFCTYCLWWKVSPPGDCVGSQL